ncbi:serine hydrolase domain-containing protein [Variovorax saccharolyticus]|uniref:serine hydrolase domain-containing protein n=1 Tax=Variovorax saccharolyticus TaxID=3053516 RepID=UPI002577302C|nr:MULTISPECIES: serine hydrolase [unclassified Variovorax]MDM0017157.1 serine hydrolase [Variovorax sp. J22R187]MDM0029309.1 serine hydrolase [Variovorax sp. J31P216]
MRRSLATFCAVALATLCAIAMPAGAPLAEPVRIDPVAAGWNAAALDALIDYVARQKSTGLVIIQDDKLIAEKLWPPAADARGFRAAFVHGTAADGATLEDVASQQKSFVAILAGIAVDKGLLDVSRPVTSYIGAGWSKATPQQEAAIAVRNLMEMNSGLKEDLSFDAAPDTKFFYNTPAYAVMKAVLEAAANLPLAEITQAWLARPAGMNDTAWRKRPALMADVGNPTGLVTTPGDIARMGQVVLNGGVTDVGVRVISKAQLDALFVRTKTNPSYGRLWWLNGGAETVGAGANARRRPGPLVAAAPADMVAAMGALDRRLFVVPSRKLVVVRTGQAAVDRDFDEQLWRLLVRAMPGS